MSKLVFLIIGLCSVMPTKVGACGTTPSFAVIHSAPPQPLPDDLFVAEVEIHTDDQWAIYGTGLHAHVKKMLVGGPVSEVILRLPEATSCDAPFANGRSGIVMGMAKGREGDALVIWPLLVSRLDNFRLPDNYYVGKEPITGPTKEP